MYICVLLEYSITHGHAFGGYNTESYSNDNMKQTQSR